MAITLDELLGRNTREATQNNVTGFPSYEDFKSSRTNQHLINPCKTMRATISIWLPQEKFVQPKA